MLNLLKSVRYAMAGIFTALRRERNLKIQIGAMLLAVIVGFYVDLSLAEWGLVILSIGFVISAELFNTAMERLSDKVSNGKIKPLIKDAKDIAAGAVLISALTALVIGIVFLIIPFFQKVIDLLKN